MKILLVRDSQHVGRHERCLLAVQADNERIEIALRTGLENDGFEECGCGDWFDPGDHDKCPTCGSEAL